MKHVEHDKIAAMAAMNTKKVAMVDNLKAIESIAIKSQIKFTDMLTTTVYQNRSLRRKNKKRK